MTNKYEGLKLSLKERTERVCAQMSVDRTDYDMITALYESLTIRVFGQNSSESRRIESLMIPHNVPAISSYSTEYYKRKIRLGLEFIFGNIDGLPMTMADPPQNLESHSATPDKVCPNRSKKRVFVVHGHERLALREAESYLHSVGLETIIIQDEPSLGQTLIEKIENNSDVDYAVIIMTADDVGASRKEDISDPSVLRLRARQNVILELGFFVGRIDRKHVAVIYSDGIERPSDIEGVLYIPYDQNDGWKYKLGRELKAAGMDLKV